jgi:single-stranded DNA-binding protein
VASEMQMLDSRGGSSDYTSSGANSDSEKPISNTEMASKKTTATQNSGSNDFDDDIPF